MKTKEFLNEWKKFINKDLLNEISFKKFQEQHPDFDTTSFNSQLRGNTDYLDIIANSINAGEQHGENDYIEQFEFYKNSIEPNRNNHNFLTINIPGGDPVSLSGKINKDTCSATFNDIQQFQQARMFALGKGNKSKLIAAYIKVINEANENDFELIAEDSNWVIFYPKTTKGSVALARSYWDGNKISYDETFKFSKGFGQNTGRINWCTSVSGQGNMFLNYHRKLNLHMYYCIKKNLSSLNDENRKLCVSLIKSRGNVSYKETNASVNGNNYRLKEEKAKQYLGSLFNVLLKDASQTKRLEIDLRSYYESISLEQYIIMRQANEDNIEDFLTELKQIAKYSKDAKKIIKFCVNDQNVSIRSYIAKDNNLLNHEMASDLIEQLANDEEVEVRRAVASIWTLSDVVNGNNLIRQLANDEDAEVRKSIASKYSLIDLDDAGDLIRQLANDEDAEVREAIARRNDILKFDPSGDLLRQLINDENDSVRLHLAYNANNFFDLNDANDLVKQLMKDKSAVVRRAILYKADPLEIDPSGDLLRQLANDEDVDIRILIAYKSYLFTSDRFNDLLRQLAKDESYKVKFYLAQNADRQSNLSERHLQIFNSMNKIFKEEIFLFFKKTNFKSKDLNELILKFIDLNLYLKNHFNKIIKFIIKKANEGYKITSQNLYKFLTLLAKNNLLSDNKTQLTLLKLVNKSDYNSKNLFLINTDTNKENYINIAKNSLQARGRSAAEAYNNLYFHEKTYMMLQDPEIAEIFVNYATKGLLRSIFDKITDLVKLKNSNEDLNNIDKSQEYLVAIYDYDKKQLSLEESIDLAIKAGPVLYQAAQNSPNAMSIKKNRLDFEKALRQQNLIESKRLNSLTITETLLKRYINLIIS